MLFGQSLFHRSSTLVTAMPPEQLAENVPSLSLFLLNIGAEVLCMSVPLWPTVEERCGCQHFKLKAYRWDRVGRESCVIALIAILPHAAARGRTDKRHR